jgi:Holliday junction DNA helicase RuvA
MISYLIGKIISKQKNTLVVMTPGGVGYEVYVTLAHAAACTVGEQVELFTYLKVSDSALDLFGFNEASNREFFSLLLTVKGVGPKTALHILSLGSVEKIAVAIARGDVTYLTAVQGLGKKTAERVVVELKTKVGSKTSTGDTGTSTIMGEVIDGLVAMGYPRDEAKNLVQGMDVAGKTTEQVLKEALKARR